MRIARLRAIVTLLSAILAVHLAHAQASVEVRREPLTVAVSQRARALAPGEVVLLSITVSRPVARVESRAFSQPAHFFATADPAVWQALIGIDVETKPGTYRVPVRATTRDGAEAEGEQSLAVGSKEFASRRMTVDPAFVNPPARLQTRIEQESKRLADVYGALTPERLWSGAFLLPVPGQPTSSFGRRSFFNGAPRTRHRGADFRAATGTPVRAPGRGRVVLSADLYFAGQTVIIDHGLGLFSQLSHLSKREVKEDDLVEPGQVLGLVGATGRVTGPHLHWSVRVGDASVDPLSLVSVLGESAPKGR